LSDYSLGALIGLFRLDGEVRQLCPLWNYHDACFDAVASLVLFKSMLDAGGLWSLPMDALLEMRCRQRL
jgi:DNA polymerase III epsilon subunit-like protein